MTYKTVLVHLNNEARARRVLQAGLEIAGHFGSHLIGLHVFPSVRLTPPVPLPFGGEIAAQIRGSIKKEDEAIRAVFDEMTAAMPFAAEWRSVTSEPGDPCKTVLRHARVADLLLTSQSDPSWQFSDVLDFPDRLVMGAGRPVLVVPNVGRPCGLPRNVSVAWSESRESARALADAMPILRAAGRVHLMTVDETSRGGADPTFVEVETALRRHGIDPVSARIVPTEYTLGEEIRVRAIDANADLLVMGCYGHSRLREMALGGVTRHMLREMTFPILMSH